MKLGEWVFAACIVAAAVHCDSSSNDGEGTSSGTGGPGAGGDGPDGGPSTVDGNPAGKIAISNVEGKTLVRGRTTRLKVSVARTAPFAGPVAITLGSAPSGVTSEPLEILAKDAVGELVVTTPKTVPLGKVTLVVSASAPGTRLSAEFPIDLTVVAAPGELDESFATNGVLSTGGTPLLAVLPDGRFFVSRLEGAKDSSVHLFGANGQIDGSFSDDGSLAAGVQTTQLVATGAGLFVAGTIESGGVFDPYFFFARRYLLNGLVDTSWGDATLEHRIGGKAPSHEPLGIAVAPNGKSVLVSPNPIDGGWRVMWVTAVGAFDMGGASGPETVGTDEPERLDRAIYDGTNVSAVGDATLLRLSATNGALVTAFGTGGKLTFPGAPSLTALADAGQDRIVVGGTAAGALYLGRSAAGKLDATFAVGGYAAHPAKSGGAIALQSDKKILQVGTVDVGGVDRCVVLRYLENGTLDPAFGNAGVSVLPVDGCVAGEVGIQPDGKILVAGPKVVRIWP